MTHTRSEETSRSVSVAHFVPTTGKAIQENGLVYWICNNLWQNSYPMQMLINCCVSPDRGAPPQSIIRMFPPSTERIFLKMTTSQSNLSTPQAPSQLPSIGASRRLYPILKSFLAKPTFSSTCNYNKKKEGELIYHHIYPIKKNASK